jgi:uncharacterized membrane protein
LEDENPDLEKLLGPDRRSIPRPKGLGAVVSLIAVLVAVGLVSLWPYNPPDLDLSGFGFAGEVVDAEVLSGEAGGCSFAEDLDCILVTFSVLEGEESGELYVQEFPDEPGQPGFEVGETVLLSVTEFEDGAISLQYADRDRDVLLGVLALLFAVAVVGLGRIRGLAALLALILSVGILILFILPAIIAGRDAVLVALVGGGAIMLISLYLAHGYHRLTHVATLGAFGALALTAALSWVAVTVGKFSGLVTEESFFLLSVPGLDLNGILLAGIVMGALGALDDVTVTQASAVWEVHGANPDMSAAELYASGLRVGRDHIVSTVNTLLLAYAGAALPLLILFTLSDQPLGVVASSEVVALEIVRTLVGSIGLVAAVPFTTWLSSRVVKRPA